MKEIPLRPGLQAADPGTAASRARSFAIAGHNSAKAISEKYDIATPRQVGTRNDKRRRP